MKLSIELSAAQAERLRHEAERLGLSPEELARAAVADILAAQDEEFRKTAEHVVRKFGELYRRLA
jgi:predicted transcriptional regulator